MLSLRDLELINEYFNAKENGEQEQGPDTFMKMDGVTVFIHRAYTSGLICYFTDMKEAYDFGHAFLCEHTSEMASEIKYKQTCVEWRDSKGGLWLADYRTGDSLSLIDGKGEGSIGQSRYLQLLVYKGCYIKTEFHNITENIIIVPPGLAMYLGSYGTPSKMSLNRRSDSALMYILPYEFHWSEKRILGA